MRQVGDAIANELLIWDAESERKHPGMFEAPAQPTCATATLPTFRSTHCFVGRLQPGSPLMMALWKRSVLLSGVVRRLQMSMPPTDCP